MLQLRLNVSCGLRCLNLQPSQLLSARRHHFPAQPDLQIIPIENIQLPLKSRDELPPILAGLQWFGCTMGRAALPARDLSELRRWV
jgi:hypothetical protein